MVLGDRHSRSARYDTLRPCANATSTSVSRGLKANRCANTRHRRLMGSGSPRTDAGHRGTRRTACARSRCKVARCTRLGSSSQHLRPRRRKAARDAVIRPCTAHRRAVLRARSRHGAAPCPAAVRSRAALHERIGHGQHVQHEQRGRKRGGRPDAVAPGEQDHAKLRGRRKHRVHRPCEQPVHRRRPHALPTRRVDASRHHEGLHEGVRREHRGPCDGGEPLPSRRQGQK